MDAMHIVEKCIRTLKKLIVEIKVDLIQEITVIDLTRAARAFTRDAEATNKETVI
jgi:predicted HTH domain antitoxin